MYVTKYVGNEDAGKAVKAPTILWEGQMYLFL